MLLGPVFGREAVTTPRRSRHYLYRSVYVASLLVLMCTAWLVMAGTQVIRNIGDMAKFGTAIFQILAPLQLALLTFLAALFSASAVAQEKDKRTLILLLMTRITNGELVLGKIAASLLNVLAMLLAALPLFMAITLFGGVSFDQILRVFLVTLTTVVAAGCLGATVGFAREKTFQTLAITALALVLWIGLWEAVAAGVFGSQFGGASASTWAARFSPVRAVWEAMQPRFGVATDPSWFYLSTSTAMSLLLSGFAVWRVRIWNPSRDVRRGQAAAMEAESIFGGGNDSRRSDAEAARQGHVDARVRTASRQSRRVWDNPILWREVCTWAYGRKVLVIRLAYVLFFAMALMALTQMSTSGQFGRQARRSTAIVPPAAMALAPYMLVSLVIINALAVTSVTNERDGQAIDLLLVTDLSPKEFVLGKLFGVMYVTKEMIALPSILCGYLYLLGGVSAENLAYLIGGWAVLVVYVSMLGIHCGMTYANSRSAVGVSLGCVFFLFLGIVTCMVIMVSFSGSFGGQLAPFLAFILGGGIGLYVTLGMRNPSPAIMIASFLLPFLTFFAITSFILHKELTVFLVTAVAYGFSTTAMMIPAIFEFDIAMGRTKLADED